MIQTLFGLLTAWFVLELVHLVAHPALGQQRYRLEQAGSLAPAVTLVLALYAANGLGPYLGLKTEFSMAMFSNLRCRGWNHLLLPGSRLTNRARYVVIDSIDGLPTAEEIGGDEAAVLAHAVLSRPADFEYRPYFLFEALARICAAAVRPTQVGVALRFDGAAYSVTAKPSFAASALRPAGFPPWHRVNVFPFVVPVDSAAPHSEQGMVVNSDGRRQLF